MDSLGTGLCPLAKFSADINENSDSKTGRGFPEVASRWYCEQQFELYPTDLWNKLCLYKKWYVENELVQTTAAKFWFSGCTDVRSCPSRAAAGAADAAGGHRWYPAESTALPFKIPPFQWIVVQNSVATGGSVTQIGDSYSVCLVPDTATALLAGSVRNKSGYFWQKLGTLNKSSYLLNFLLFIVVI